MLLKLYGNTIVTGQQGSNADIAFQKRRSQQIINTLGLKFNM